VIALLAAAALGAAPQPVPFEVVSVSFDLRTLTVAYESGPCWQGNRRVGLREDARAITLAVADTRVDGCTHPPRYRRLHVRLERPVGGRSIEGAPRIAAAPQLERRTAPRVLDFAAGDARRALALQGFRTRSIGRTNGTVAFQSPLPNTAAAGRVRLTIGRGLFRTRALRRCIARATVRTRTRLPKPGDGDAPDAVVDVFAGPVRGFVALYADRLRGRELLQVVRRNTRAFDGIVEHRGHVTIVWAGHPSAAVRDRVRRCAYGRLGRMAEAQSQASR
jgi:hypothetical protein